MIGRGHIRVILPVLVALLGLVRPAFGQQVQISLDRKTLSVDEDLTMEVRATGAFDELVAPPTPGFDVGSTSRSSEFSMGPGGTVQSHVLRQTLVPGAPGRYTIGPAVLRHGGREVARSDTVIVTVTGAPTETMTPEQARDIEARAGERYFLQPVFPARPIYVGEPFVMAYLLYVRTDAAAMSAQWRQAPAFDAFSMEDLRAQRGGRPRRQFVGRHHYDVSVQAQYLLTPLAAGKVEVGAAVMDVMSGDLFQRRRYTVRAPAVSLDIRPLPAQGRPPEFHGGNIGRYELETELRPTAVRAGERAVLTLRITGRGAVESVRAPSLPRLDGISVDALPTSDADRVERNTEGVSGTRVFQWVLVPEAPGEVTIPPIRFAYFDPEEGRYRVVESAAMPLRVEGQATAAPGVVNAVPPGVEPVTEDSFEAGLRDIRAESDLRSRRPVRPHRTLWFWLLALVPGAALLFVETVIALRRRRTRTAAGRRMRRAARVARRALATAQKAMAAGDSRAFFEALRGALTEFLDARLNLSLRGLTHEQLRRALVERGTSDALAVAVVDEIENADFARFAPVSLRDDEMHNALERSRRLVADLDKLPFVERREGHDA